MADWYPYLQTLFPSQRGSRAKIEEVLKHRTALSQSRLQTEDRVREIAWFDDVPVAQQLFALASLTALLGDRSDRVRSRVIELLDDLLAHTHRSTLSDLDQVCSRPTVDSIQNARRSLSAIIRGTRMPRELPFSAVAALRVPIFAICALAAVEQVRRRDFADSQELSSAAFVTSPDGIDLVQALDRWLRSAPFFVRYVVLHWIDCARLDTWRKGHVDQLLLDIHRRDVDGIVAAEALLIWARSERRRLDIAGAVQMLEEEYAHPRLVRNWQPPSTVRHAAFELAGATLRALASLIALQPDAPQPRAALQRIITAPPSSRLNLFLFGDERGKIDMFRTALLIRGTSLRVLARIDPKNPRKATAGFKSPLRVVDPDGKVVPEARDYWVTPAASEATDPVRWVFRVRDVAAQREEGTADLLSVISPSLAYECIDADHAQVCGGEAMTTRAPERAKGTSPQMNRWPLRDAIDEELNGRGGVILEALRVLGDLLTRPGGVESAEDWMIKWLSNVAPAITLATTGDHVRIAVRNKMRHLLMAVMSAPRFFDCLFPSRSITDVGQLEASMLASATERVPDALPGDESLRWIRENRNLLLAVAQHPQYDDRTRARIALALVNSRLCDESPWREAVAALPFDETLARKVPPIAVFFDHATIERSLAAGKGGQPSVTLDWAVAFAPHAERLARTLDGVWPYATDIERDSSMCVDALILVGGEPPAPKAGKHGPPNDAALNEWNRQRNHLRMILRRVTTALANRQEELSPELRQLRDGLVRLPDGAELRAYIAVRNRHHRPYDGDWTRILVRLLSRLFAERARPRQTTVQGILQELATPGTVLSELIRQAETGGRDFLRHVLFRRDRTVVPPSSPYTSVAGGEILLQDETSVTASLALLQTGAPVRVPAGLVVPAFVHRAERSQRLRCVAAIPHIPEHAVDLHTSRLSQPDRVRLLREGANRPSGIVVVGRVIAAGVIDIGVDELRPNLRDRDLIWGAAIAVLVRPKGAPPRLSIRRPSEENEPAPARPALADELTFERIAYGDEAERLVDGILTSSRDAQGRRVWTAHIQGRDVQVRRRELTGDLRTLFELDAAADDDPVLQRLATEPMAISVRERFTRPSIVRVPPLYDLADVVLADAAGELDRLVFSHEADEVYIFEVIGKDRANGTLPVFGAFASIRPDELLDEKRRPWPATRLRPSVTVYVERLYRTYADGGWTISTERDLGSVPLLGVVRTDRHNMAVRELFSHDKVVRLRVEDGRGELLDAPPLIPRPTVRLLRDGFPEGEVQAVVRQWYPADLHVEVDELKTVTLAKRSAREWIDLQPPAASQGVASWITSREPAIRVDGLLVQPDWTFRWLPPVVPAPDELAKTAQLPVLITRLEYGRTVPLGTLTAKDLPWLNDGEHAQGVVASQPEGHPQQVVHEVLWSHSTGQRSWQYSVTSGERLSNGDLVDARRDGEAIRLTHTSRRFYGTTIFRPERAAVTMEETVPATLIAFPEDTPTDPALDLEAWDDNVNLEHRERDSWLFVIAPAKLIEIPRERLRGTDLLQDAYPLSRVMLRKLAGFDWVVEDVGAGAFVEAMSAPWKLHLYGMRWPMKVDLSSTHQDGVTRRNIRYDIRPENLPFRVDRSAEGARRLNTTAVDCALTHYELYVTPLEDGFAIEPSFYLGPANVESLGLPALEASLDLHKRLDDVDGHTHAGRDELLVQATNYACDNWLPLPLAEQTWVPLSRQVARADHDYRFTVVADQSGAPLVSLRRQPPLPLVDWLEKHGIAGQATVRRTLYYYGEISDNELAECGCARADLGGGRLLLFERAPGDTLIVPLRNTRFLGLPLDASLLAAGDAVTMFRIIATQDELLLDIREVVHDILQEVTDYDRRQGLFYAQVRRDAFDVHGLFGDRLINMEQGWQVQIEGWEAGHTFADGTFIYVKFSGADKVNRILRFKPVDPKTAFTRGNLVYVQAESLPVPRAGSLILPMRPLAGPHRKYFIPDTLYSRRRWRLRQTASERGMFLAKVYDDQGRLSLIHLPTRSVETLLAERESQVVVTNVNHLARTMEVELREGLNVRVGFDRFVDQRDLVVVEDGDILMLERTFDATRLIITDRIRSHRTYLDIKSRPTVLVELWSNLKYREEHRDREGRLSCNIVGLPQLSGRSRVSEQNFGSMELLPHVVTGKADHGTIALDDQVGENVEVGQIEVSQAPQLVRPGRRIPLSWRQITYRRGCADELQRWLAEWSWRDTAERTGNVGTSVVIARTLGDEAVSFTAAAHAPLPPDHIVEQFGPSPQPGDRKRFAVATADRWRVVLEIAPGRYATLHTRMIVPRFREQCVAPRAWEKLGPGDVVMIEVTEPNESQPHPFLPSFRLWQVAISPWRELESGAVVPLVAREGHVLAGPPDHGGLHADDFAHLLTDKVLDLREESREASVELLRAAFRKHGSRLVLRGTVKNWSSSERGRRLYVDVGVRSPDAADNLRDPSVVVPSDRAPDTGTPVRVRVLDLAVERGRITKLACDIRVDASPVRFARFGSEGAEVVAAASRGDIVAVYLTDDGSPRVSGYDSLPVIWSANPRDGVERLGDAGRSDFLQTVLGGQGRLLWATLEGIGRDAIIISRRRQIERLLGTEDIAVMGTVIGAAGPDHVVVDLHGVPNVIAAAAFVRGLTEGCRDVAAALAQKHAEIEVLVRSDGRLSAVDVYERPPEEFDAVVECCLSTGLVCRYEGTHLFVPLHGLAWCDFSEAAMRAIFEPMIERGEPITVRRLDDIATQFSHKRIGAFAREARRMNDLHELSRPEMGTMAREPEQIFITSKYVDTARRRSVVASHNGLLMELHGEATLSSAYVMEIDLRKREIILASSPAQSGRWMLPRHPVRQLYSWSEESFREAAADIAAAARAGGAALADYLSKTRLTLTFRNLRVVLESLHSSGIMPSDLPAGSEGVPQPPLLACVASLDTPPPEVFGPVVAFGRGYWHALNGRMQQALPDLRAAAAAASGHTSFDVQLTLARVLFALDDRYGASEVVRSACHRLFAGAHLTLPFLLIRPAAADAMVSKWTAALRTGDFESLRTLLECGGSAMSLPSLAARLWIAAAENGSGDVEFERTVVLFLEALHDQEDLQGRVDSRFYALAAQLCFAAGDTARGWRYLDGVTDDASTELGVHMAWKRWLRANRCDRGDELLGALNELLIQMSWRRVLHADAFKKVWDKFHDCVHEWQLSPQTVRIVPAAPAQADKLERWGETNDVRAAVAYLRDVLVNDGGPASSQIPIAKVRETAPLRRAGEARGRGKARTL